jgi:hypothetical protein
MRRSIIIFALLLICYAYTLPRWSDWNQNSRLNLVLAMVDDRTVQIDKYVANTGDYALYKGHAYTDKPPGLSFIALPAYYLLQPLIDTPFVRERLERIGAGAAFGATLNEQGTGLRADKIRFAIAQYVLTLVAVATPAALLGVLLYAALCRLGLSSLQAAFGTLAYGLATPALPYAGNFYSHQLVAALLFGAFFVAWPAGAQKAMPGRPFVSALLCGLLLGWAVISEYPVAPAAAIIGLYALARRGWRWLLPLALGGAIPGILLISYDLAAFGTILPVGYAYSALWQEQHHTGFMSLTYPQPAALWGLFFSVFRGLFVRAPWLLLAVAGYVLWWRSKHQRSEWWLLLLVPLSITLIYSSSGMWWGGFSVGPRYIVPLLPFIALVATWWISQQTNVVIKLASNALIYLSAVLIWLETHARQLFPLDTIANPWTGYVFPAWAEGDIARNLGMALGLDGPWSLLPLLFVLLAGATLTIIIRPAPKATNPSEPLISQSPNL